MKASLLIVIVIFICLVNFISACVPTNMATQDQQYLNQRVKECMDAKIAGNWGEVYTYLDTTYRENTSLSSFINRSRIKFDSYSVDKITLNENQKSAEAQVSIDFSSRGFHFNGQKDTQTWIYENNNWYQKIAIQSIRGLFSN